MKRTQILAGITLFVAAAWPAASFADTLTFTLINPLQTAAPGATVTYQATVLAPASNAGNVFLNGDSYTVDSPATLDDSDFFANSPIFLLPGESDTFDIFTLTVPFGTSGDVTSLGNFVLLGGADGFAQDALASASFGVTTTPEPSSVLLLSSGAGAFFCVAWRKRGR